MQITIFSNEDGEPWIAFVWGKADHSEVAKMITSAEIEDQTGLGDYFDEIPWPPEVEEFYIRAATSDDESVPLNDFDGWYYECEPDHPDAVLVTGHKFQ